MHHRMIVHINLKSHECLCFWKSLSSASPLQIKDITEILLLYKARPSQLSLNDTKDMIFVTFRERPPRTLCPKPRLCLSPVLSALPLRRHHILEKNCSLGLGIVEVGLLEGRQEDGFQVPIGTI